LAKYRQIEGVAVNVLDLGALGDQWGHDKEQRQPDQAGRKDPKDDHF
jgi:hypothetical protein